MIRIGVLAEDDSDVAVLRELIGKLSKPKSFSIRSFVGHGCGKLRSKCRDWAHQLHLKGCTVLLLVHDLDSRRLSELRAELNRSLCPCPVSKHSIIIPVQELESWLLCDANALKIAFSLKRLPKLPGSPEAVNDPKEKLEELIWRNSGKTRRYINAVHNQKIARHVKISELKKCPAFREFCHFVQAELN